MLSRVFRGLVDVLSPPCCACCLLPLPQPAHGFCSGCELLIDEAATSSSELDDAACAYGGPLADAITHLKYGGRSEVAPALARLLVKRARRLAGQAQVVCCVPLHRSRLSERGFNQSALLAAPVARMLGVPFRPGLLLRTRATPPQASLDRLARSHNLFEAFSVRGNVRGQRVLVVDDVVTTYATFFELRRTLDAAGAARVYTLALARTEREKASD